MLKIFPKCSHSYGTLKNKVKRKEFWCKIGNYGVKHTDQLRYSILLLRNVRILELLRWFSLEVGFQLLYRIPYHEKGGEILNIY